jgi:predicted O-linked N-acetylglucosamine transferase (SPINDLY family)
MNRFCKVSRPALACWGKLLRQTSGSRLLLHAFEGSHRDRALNALADQGIDPQRVRFVGNLQARQYFEAYGQIDILLDPFPCSGGTTTCDALWMGVPVVSLAGNTAVGRGGLSILSHVGLPELVARSQDEYVRIASELAGDLPRLSHLRAEIRAELRKSPLMDAPRFARDIESAYRGMWRTWCEEMNNEDVD